jgi:uncharacterized membrane protein
MSDLETTVAVYDDMARAESDWAALEEAGRSGQLDLADAALVESRDGEAVIVKRQSHHGWGKGALVGAVVGVLFPPSILGAAVVGAGGGAIIARLTRKLGRGEVKDLGDAMDSGTVVIVMVSDAESTQAAIAHLGQTRKTVTRTSASVEDVQEALQSVPS